MDGFEDKKWFIYMGDHHEGPFSLAEIQSKMQERQITPESYVWGEGMADWSPMADMTQFIPVVKSAPPSAPMPTATAKTSRRSEDKVEPQVSSVNLSSESSQEAEVPGVSSISLVAMEAPVSTPEPATVTTITAKGATPVAPHDQASDSETKFVEIAQPEPQKHSEKASDSKRSAGRLIPLLILVLIVAGGGFAYTQGFLNSALNSPAVQSAVRSASDLMEPYVLKLSEKVPALQRWISPIRTLDDVTPEEYQQLRDAASVKGDGGVKAAVALSRVDLFSPSFYLGTNLPEGASLDVYVEGIGDTLLNQTSYSTKVEAVVSKHLAHTTALHSPDGRPLPRGEYTVFVTPSEHQTVSEATALLANQPVNSATIGQAEKLPASLPKDSKILAVKSYFLGGAKDAMYTARLKEFHDKLGEKVKGEVAEVKQFVATLETQLLSSVSSFNSFGSSTGVSKAKAKAKAQKAAQWNTFNTQWLKLEGQLNDTFQKWTPATLENDYYYPTLYLMTQQLGATIDKVHAIQSSYFTTPGDPKTFEITLAGAVSSAQSSLNELKVKIDEIQKLPPTPNGMPQREVRR